MELITGLGSATHITALQDACWHRGIWGSDCILQFGNNLNPSIISNNEIQIQSGIGSVQGRFFIVEPNTYDSVTINNGTVGENRIDLIVAQYQKNEETQVESMTWEVIQGTPSADTPVAPSYTQGNIDNGDILVQFPVFQVNIEGITLSSVDTLMNIVAPVDSIGPTLLFQGTVTNGTFALNESAFNYRNLAIGISSASGGGAFAWALIPVIPNSSLPGYQAVMGYNGGIDSDGKNSISTYCGRIQIDEEGTQITFVQQITNVSHTSGEVHGGGSQYSITYVYGIR